MVCHSVERGPEHCAFDEDDIQAASGINGVEMEAQRDLNTDFRGTLFRGRHGARTGSGLRSIAATNCFMKGTDMSTNMNKKFGIKEITHE
jgi:hypothetical protein